MCGIFGTVNATPEHNRMLTIFNEDRGSDSVGVLFDGKRVRCDRSATKSILDRGLADRCFSAQTFLGHTRSKTHGAALKRNAHPFRYGNIVGAHNGVIQNFHQLKWKYKEELKDRQDEFKDMDVDSQIIFWLLNEKGHEGLREIDGYAAIWWQDLRDMSKFYMWSWANQYAVCENNIGDTPVLAFSSDPDHLKLAGFKHPVVIPGDGHLITYCTNTARSIDRIVVAGAEKRQRGEWRVQQQGGNMGYLHGLGDDTDLAEMAGVPEQYRRSSAANPTAGGTNGTMVPATQQASSGTVVIDKNLYNKFFFCEKCNHVLPGDVIIRGTAERFFCPKCLTDAEGIHPTDAEWLSENLPETVISDEKLEELKKFVDESDKEAEEFEEAEDAYENYKSEEGAGTDGGAAQAAAASDGDDPAI